MSQRNASEFEAFLKVEAARQGRAHPSDWIRTVFMPAVENISRECFEASMTPWIWEMVGKLGAAGATSDPVKAATLEPDGAFLFVAVEVLIDVAFNVRLIEFTSFPADVHELQKSFREAPWTYENESPGQGHF